MKFEECLRTLGLEECIQAFRDNDIDDEAILLLGETELKELIPKIGPRIKFKKLIKETFHEDQQDLTLIPDISENNVDNDNTLSETSESSSAQGNQNTECLDGRALIKEGQGSGGLLKEGSRRKLSQLVINYCIENKPGWKISTEDFYRLASEIVTLFPRESIVVYYSAYLSGKDCNSAKKNASGKLYESYINKRRKLRQSGELAGTRRQHSSSCSSSRSASVTSDISNNNKPDDYDDNISFLKSNVEPWRKVVECWSATCTHRLKILYDEKQGGIKLEYPALKQPEGYTLLMNDFNELFPNKENNLFSSLEIYRENINYTKRKRTAAVTEI